MNSGMLFLWTTWRDPPHYNKKANFSTRGRTRTAYMSSSVGSGLNLNGPAAAESSCPTSPRSPSPAVDIPPTSLSRAGANPAPRSEPPPGFRPITVSRCVPGAGLKDDPIICKDFCYGLALLQPGPIRKEFQVCFLSVFFSLYQNSWGILSHSLQYLECFQCLQGAYSQQRKFLAAMFSVLRRWL